MKSCALITDPEWDTPICERASSSCASDSSSPVALSTYVYHIRVYIHIHTYIHACIYIYIYIYITCMYACIHQRKSFIQLCFRQFEPSSLEYLCMFVCIYMHAHVCTCERGSKSCTQLCWTVQREIIFFITLKTKCAIFDDWTVQVLLF